MRSLVEKSSGKVLGFWPTGQDVSIKVANKSGEFVPLFDGRIHEWDENAPGDADFLEVGLYTRVAPGQYVKAEKVDEKQALKEELRTELFSAIDTKLAAEKAKQNVRGA